MEHKKIGQKLFSFIFMCLVLSVLCSASVFAASSVPSCEKTHYVYTSNAGYVGVSDMLFIKSTSEKTKITSVKTSNKLIKGKVEIYGKQAIIRLTTSPKATTGTSAVLTIKISIGSKKYTLKSKIIVRRTAPFSKVTIGGQNILSSTTNSEGTYLVGENLSGNATVSAGKNKVINLVPYKTTQIESILYVKKNNTVKNIKNGAKLNLSKGDQLIVFFSRKPSNLNSQSAICDNALEGFFGITVN